MIAAGKRSILFAHDVSGQQGAIAFDVAAAVALNRPMFDGPDPPVTGTVAWLVDMEHLRERLWDKMTWWRGQKGIGIGTAFPLKPIHLAPNADPVAAIGRYHAKPALIVRDYSSTDDYNEGSSYALFDWLDTVAPRLVETYGAAILTCISATNGVQDLANRCDILVGAKRPYEMAIELHWLQPRSAMVLKLQTRGDAYHTLLVADRFKVPA